MNNAANGRADAANGLETSTHRVDTSAMLTNLKAFLSLTVLVASAGFLQKTAQTSSGPEYTSDGEMKKPDHYREWVYLTSGFDMSYNPAMKMDHHMFDNVFVNPEAYRAFTETGTWPDKTVLVLEGRMAEGKGSINKNGNYQSTDFMGVEAHVKDESRFPGKWAFFAFGVSKTGSKVPDGADCYTCHAAHGAVDTTFVQFYPTLLPIAQSKKTLSQSYLSEEASSPKP